MAATSAPRVLVVDDEPVVRDVLTRYLTHEGFEVDAAADGHAALSAIEARAPSVIVLDLMLPRLSGLELLRLVRLESTVPVIILSARVSERERIAGLELGADDYVTKPYSPGEVVARVRAVLRRTGGESQTPLEFGDLVHRPGAARGDPRRARSCTRRARSSTCSSCWRRTPAASTPGLSSSSRCGATCGAATPRR